ncbi:Crp/Fnr family transcriptional regulator [Dyadobacter helix]|uniref:Crp/Fnr family transcriptional regulator n=1 Tax=Dyadobacter helix TaxID=2822344 RepID=UPI001BFCB55A|nr:cyclic nucleotide-binding domain-containing protein [Dyadobacter sp. CECT 9275]
MNAFINFLSKITPLSIEVQQAINAITVFRKPAKGDLLLRNGEICREFHFLAEGFARVYYLKDGKDVTAWFTGEGGIVSAIDSLFTGNPSIYHIEILEDAEVYSGEAETGLYSILSGYRPQEHLSRIRNQYG